jgi:hypothetical protein
LQIQKYSTTVASGSDSVYFNNQVFQPYSYWHITSFKTTYNFTYLEIPIIIRYVSSHDDKFGIFAEAGCIVGVFIGGSELDSIYLTGIATNGSYFTTPNGNTGYVFNAELQPVATPSASSINIEGHLALGLYIPISKRCSFITDVSINKGFTNVGNSSNDVTNFQGLYYYYNKNNNLTIRNVSNYGNNFSALFSIRVNLKLGSNCK